MNVNEFLDILKTVFYPNRCAGCGKVIPFGGYWCENCENDISVILQPICSKCGNELEKCDCKNEHVFSWDAVVAPFYYEGSVRSAIHRFKFRNHPKLSFMFANAMSESVKSMEDVEKIDVIACVPMVEKKKKERGYNQSELLAKDISGILNIPFSSSLLIKVRDTKTQHSLSGQQRAGNVFGAYAVSNDIPVKGKTILLCDDIKTTGATLSECCKILKLAGAREVYCVCAAITNKEKIDN